MSLYASVLAEIEFEVSRDPFPDPELTPADGIVGFGGNLSAEVLLAAYRKGIFPWPMEGVELPWFCPARRAILELEALHVSRSLKKAQKKLGFTFTLDQAFERVIRECAQSPRPGQDGTWITPEMIDAYVVLHLKGHAHSVEVWQEENLVGGLYGVDSGGVFSAESMFYRQPNASKLALLYLMDHFESRGLKWMDIQVMTPHMKVLGAREISRKVFLRRLRETQALGLRLFSL